VEQSPEAVHEHAPPTGQSAVQSAQTPPSAPQAVVDTPATQAPAVAAEQHPPLHAWVAEHALVHVCADARHDWAAEQSLDALQPQTPGETHVVPAPLPAHDAGLPHVPLAVQVCTPSPEQRVAPEVHGPASPPPLLEPEPPSLVEPLLELELLAPSLLGPSSVASLPASGAAAQLAVSVQLSEPPHAASARPTSAPAIITIHGRIQEQECHGARREAHGELRSLGDAVTRRSRQPPHSVIDHFMFSSSTPGQKLPMLPAWDPAPLTAKGAHDTLTAGAKSLLPLPGSLLMSVMPIPSSAETTKDSSDGS
jgi:hypothetical protein